MSTARTGDLVSAAQQVRRAVGAFNVATLEHVEAVVSGAERAGRPVIVQISENAVRFHGSQVAPLLQATLALSQRADVPVAVHFDHVQDSALLLDAAVEGFSSIMFDGSPLEYEQNVVATRAAATWAAGRGVWLEAELGEIGGKDGAHAPGARTDPGEAARFVAATGVDALAVAVGSSHAMTERTARLDATLIDRISDAVRVPLVLHGSSGVPDEELSRAVRAGISKVNFGTILNAAYTSALRARLLADSQVVDPRSYLVAAREEMTDVVEHLLVLLATPPS